MTATAARLKQRCAPLENSFGASHVAQAGVCEE